ncbi:MAG: Uma2 family endonuclease [Polyangiales bacterium]
MTQARKRVELTFEVPYTHPSWVLEDEKVSESAAHDGAARVVDSTWRAWARRHDRVVSVYRNLAVRWDEDNPRVGADPDVCLLEPPPATPEVGLTSLRTWVEGDEPPKVALEVVSEGNPRKDYEVSPRKYAAAGLQELWVFDPNRFGPSDDGGPWVLQVWERNKRGDFRRVYAGDGPAWSEYFRAWLVVSADGMLLRMADDEEGTRLWPTEAEEAELARADAERARADAEALQARVAALEAQLAAARGGR